MNRLRKICLAIAAPLFCVSGIFAQEKNPADTTAVTTPAAPQDAASDDTEETLPPFDEKAPIMKGKPKRYFIRKINLRGIEYLNKTVVQASTGLVPGDSIYLPSENIADVIAKLWNQRLFADVKVGATIDGDSVDMEISVRERPRVYRWLFEGEGVGKGRQKDIIEKLQLKTGGELSDYVIDKNTKLIKKYFAEKAFRNAEVSVRIENDPVIQNAVNVTFVIDRKRKVKIGKINFHGNEQFKDKRLRRTFKKTHQKSINFFKSSKLKEDDYETDKENLIDFYNSKGYRNFTILSDSIYPINDRRLGIDLSVSEGNKYYIRNITWVGNSVYPTSDLQRMFGVKSGDTYDKKTINKRLGYGKEDNPEDMSIKSLYQNNGYLMSQIEPAEIIIGADSIDMEMKIFEGKQFSINNVGISGNMRVNDEVIRRELYTLPGELYNRALLMQTIRQLAGMGHFDQEKIMPDIKPVSNELVDINWPLEEQASDQFNIAGGWGSGTFVGSVGITLNNLSVRNFFMASLPDGAEPEVLDLGADQRNLLQGAGHELHRPVAGRAQAQLVHAVGTPLGTEQRLLFLADLHAALPHDGRRRRSGQAPTVARPQLLVLRRGLLRTLRAEKLGLLRDEERRGQHAGFEVRALAQHGQPADLPAQRFGVHRLGSTHPALLAVGRQGLRRRQSAGRGALPLDRIPQMAVEEQVVLPAHQ